ncbi:MAG: CPBP family intramembrane metalloprotease [Bacteroidetes bacterium]|nr:CPBP family intramembrane metalloprotease [Bacteroidota bacterium]
MSYFRLKTLIKFNWQFGLAFIILFGIPRFLMVLDANQTRNYNFVSLIFLVMWITPFIFLTRKGRKFIGIIRTKKYTWLVYSFLLGITACTIAYFIGKWLYQHSISNWFVYISNSYGAIPIEELKGNNKHLYFVIFALIGMTFSPIGEELLYRGLIHQSFVSRYGNNKASIIDSLAFTIVHLAHFGIIYVNGTWEFLFIPAFLWLLLMFLTSRMFFYCKSKSESIYGAILSHAGFNLAMTFFIFYYIL